MERELQPVFKLMKNRALEGSKPGRRTDGAKVGVVVEGGALRAVASAGSLVALQKMGLRDSVDIVYGGSIGSGNAAFFLSDQMDQAIATYWNLVNNPKFVRPLRLLGFKEMVDTGFLRSQVEKHYPYDYAKLADSGINLGVFATKVNLGAKDRPLTLIDSFKDRNDLLEALVAAVQMPFIGGKPYPYRDMLLWDAGIMNGFPIQRAIEDGCTHILAVSSSPLDYVPRDHNLFGKIVVSSYLSRYHPTLASTYRGSARGLKTTMDYLRQKHLDQSGPPFIATLALPPGVKRLATFEKNAKILQQTARIAEKGTYRAFRS